MVGHLARRTGTAVGRYPRGGRKSASSASTSAITTGDDHYRDGPEQLDQKVPRAVGMRVSVSRDGRDLLGAWRMSTDSRAFGRRWRYMALEWGETATQSASTVSPLWRPTVAPEGLYWHTATPPVRKRKGGDTRHLQRQLEFADEGTSLAELMAENSIAISEDRR